MREFGEFNIGEHVHDIHERALFDINHLNRMRHPDGSHNSIALEGVHINKRTAAKEGTMPFAVSTIHQELVDGDFMWMDQASHEVSASGYRFHTLPAALERVDVEMDEDRDVVKNLRPGYIKMLVSPRMTRYDASLEDARREHLGDDDAVRIHMLDIDEAGRVRGKFMQSLLVRDIPLQAWVDWLNDPGNMFGRSMNVTDNKSALGVMRTHAELEVPEGALPEGVVSIVEAVLPYISDAGTYRRVAKQIELYGKNQEQMDQTAASVADRWLGFEVALADSVHYGVSTPEITQFITDLGHEWGDEMLMMLGYAQRPDGLFTMSTALAIKLEEARQNTLWVAAAVATGNSKVIKKLGTEKAAAIYEREMFVQIMMHNGYNAEQLRAVEAQNNRLVAQTGVTAGGGCAGIAKGDFNNDSPNNIDNSWIQSVDAEFDQGRDDPESWDWKLGYCRVEKCYTRPNVTEVGPCDVCRGCQSLFDQGKDPTQVYAGQPSKSAPERETIVAIASSLKQSELALVA